MNIENEPWLRRERTPAGVVTVTLARPDGRNSMSRRLSDELANAIVTCSDPEVRCVILTTASDHFCAGADLKERRSLADLTEVRSSSVRLTRALMRAPVPVIAAVRGHTLGWGLELLLAADIVISDETGVFGLPEVGIGIVPGAGGTQLLARRVGWGRANELLYTGRRLTADEALATGLVDSVVSAADLPASARHLARRVASMSPNAIRLAKRANVEGVGVTLDDGFAAEGRAWDVASGSADYREGLDAFFERREPRWTNNKVARRTPGGDRVDNYEGRWQHDSHEDR